MHSVVLKRKPPFFSSLSSRRTRDHLSPLSPSSRDAPQRGYSFFLKMSPLFHYMRRRSIFHSFRCEQRVLFSLPASKTSQRVISSPREIASPPGRFRRRNTPSPPFFRGSPRVAPFPPQSRSTFFKPFSLSFPSLVGPSPFESSPPFYEKFPAGPYKFFTLPGGKLIPLHSFSSFLRSSCAPPFTGHVLSVPQYVFSHRLCRSPLPPPSLEEKRTVAPLPFGITRHSPFSRTGDLLSSG